MDLRQLRTFVTVAEQGTVSRAALRLRVAQPALSRQISALEASLGVALFDRVRRRLVLTGQGEQLLADCRGILGAVESLSERARLLRRQDAGVLKVGATPQMIDGSLRDVPASLCRTLPRRADQAGGGGRSGPGRHAGARGSAPRDRLAAGRSRLRTIRSRRCRCPRSNSLPPAIPRCGWETAGNLEIGRLARQPLLLLDPSFVVRTTVDAACRLAGFRPTVVTESRSPHTLLVARRGRSRRGHRAVGAAHAPLSAAYLSAHAPPTTAADAAGRAVGQAPPASPLRRRLLRVAGRLSARRVADFAALAARPGREACGSATARDTREARAALIPPFGPYRSRSKTFSSKKTDPRGSPGPRLGLAAYPSVKAAIEPSVSRRPPPTE